MDGDGRSRTSEVLLEASKTVVASEAQVFEVCVDGEAVVVRAAVC